MHPDLANLLIFFLIISSVLMYIFLDTVQKEKEFLAQQELKRKYFEDIDRYYRNQESKELYEQCIESGHEYYKQFYPDHVVHPSLETRTFYDLSNSKESRSELIEKDIENYFRKTSFFESVKKSG